MRIISILAAVLSVTLAGAGWAEQRIVRAPDGVGNLRAEAGWWADVAGLAPNGSKVQVLARFGDWTWVQGPRGVVGWVESAQLVAIAPKPVSRPAVASKPQAAAAPKGKYLSVVYTEQGNLNLRSGPGTGFAVVTPMTRGSWVEVQEKSGPWARMRHESGAEGWAYARYLTR